MKPERILFWSYSRFYSFRKWRRQHVTPAGIMMLSAFFLCCPLGLNISKTFVYQAAVLCLVVLIAGMVASVLPFRAPVKVRRHLPQYGSINEDFVYDIEIENLSGKVQKGLMLFECIHDPRPAFDVFASTREPYEKQRNVWDRKTYYYRWSWLLKKNEKLKFEPIPLPDLAADKTTKIRMTCRPKYRGYLNLEGITIGRPDILGLFNRLTHIKQPERVLILPRITPVEQLNLTSSRHFHPGGVNLASSVGNSDEFMSLRGYRPGDPLRNIHWKSVAKTSQLVIKEFEDEHFVRHSLILDTFCQPEDEQVFETAVSLAASYVNQLQGAETIMDLLFVGKKVFSFTSGRGLGHTGKMLEVLACVEKNTKKKISELLPVLHRNIDKISGSVCIFLGWDDERKAIYELFEFAGIDVQVFVVSQDTDAMERKILKDMGHLGKIKVVAP